MTERAAEAQTRAKQQQLDGEILKAHGDLFEILNDPKFAQFKALPITANSSTKYGDLLSTAYFTDMNAKGFIELLNQYKAWTAPKDIDGITQVDTAGGYGPVALPAEGGGLLRGMEDKINLLHLRQTGKLTRAQFREMLNPRTPKPQNGAAM
jgi:hypothetical protein